MGERRVSGWFILSAVFLVLVFGLFFTFTERKTWPEHRVELGPMDMRLVPPVSTLWCQAVALHSDHPFVAYRVNHSGQINPLRLTSQIVKLGRKKLGRSWSTNHEIYKYFLLPSSVIEIVACSSYPGMKLLVFKGDSDVLECLQALYVSLGYQLADEKFSKIIDFHYEDSSEEDYSDYDSDEIGSSSEIITYKKICSSLLQSKSIDLNYDDGSLDCSPFTKLHPLKVNISSADHYVIVVWNANPNVTNYVNLRVMLDRTRYVVQSSGQPLDICSQSHSCTIGLSFVSGDRVLVTVPEEPNPGRSAVVIRSRCKPRLAVFAVLSVFLPLVLFLCVAFVIRADREALNRIFCNKRDTSTRLPSRSRIVAPLLDDRTASSFESLPAHENRNEVATVQIDDMPPPYHSLYDPPPPYTCVRDKQKNSDQTR